MIYTYDYFPDQDYNAMRAARALKRSGGSPQASPSGL
jgi:hypothetical protein